MFASSLLNKIWFFFSWMLSNLLCCWCFFFSSTKLFSLVAIYYYNRKTGLGQTQSACISMSCSLLWRTANCSENDSHPCYQKKCCKILPVFSRRKPWLPDNEFQWLWWFCDFQRRAIIVSFSKMSIGPFLWLSEQSPHLQSPIHISLT